MNGAPLSRGLHAHAPRRSLTDERTTCERKAGPEVTAEDQPDNGAADEADEQPDERDHMPSRQITELVADMEPDADAPQEPPLDAKSAALTEESKGPADHDR